MRLHPDVQAVIESAPSRNFADGTVAEARSAHAAGAAARPPGPDMAEVRDLELGGRPARRYTPHGATESGVVFFHGGGWVVGSCDTHDGQCRHLAARSGATVYSVDYRLAPEHRFPAAVDDAVAATVELLSHGDDAVDTSRVGVAGDSSGGNLAAAVALELRGRSLPRLKAQLLVYPAVDASMTHASHEEFAGAPFLTAAEMRWFYEHYAPGVDAVDPRLSPLAADDLSDLPPALVITAAVDVLRDEGEAYAQALATADVDASAVRYSGATHGFFGWAHTAAPSRAAMTLAGAFLREKLA